MVGLVTCGPTCSSVSSKMLVHCTMLMEKVSTTYKLTDGVLVTVMHIIKQRDRTMSVLTGTRMQHHNKN